MTGDKIWRWIIIVNIIIGIMLIGIYYFGKIEKGLGL